MRAIVTMALAGVTAAAQTRVAPGSPAGWKTYRSAEYGFSIDFPPDMTFYANRPVLAPQLSMIPICDETTVACFEYNGDAFKHTVIAALGVAVNVLRDNTTNAQCDNIYSLRMKTSVIHGMRFHYADVGSAAAGSSAGGPDYRAFYRHVCFEIALTTAQSDIGAVQYAEYGIEPVDKNALKKVQDEMHAMMESFALIGAVEDGSEWNVYHDSGCGGSFEYPAWTTVQEVVPFTLHGYESRGVTCEQTFQSEGRTYTVAAKANLRDSEAANQWLVSSGMPGLDRVNVIGNGERFTEYSDGTYTYLYVDSEMFVFTVSRNGGKPMRVGRDKVFAHLLRSFRFV